MTTIAWESVARLVADGVAVARGDRVSVFFTDTSAMDAVAAFVEECLRRGAVPQVLAVDERFDAAALRWSDVAALRAPPPLEVAAMEWSDVHVSFRSMMPPYLEGDPERAVALRHARGVVSTMRWEGTRWALVRVPTVDWALAEGLDGEELLREWVASFDADWNDARHRMSSLCDRITDLGPVIIEDQWGHLELDVSGRRWVPFSGSANWPDGEIATAPVDDRVSGTIRFPGAFLFAGIRIRDLELEFSDGLVVRESAAEGRDFVSRLLDTDAGSRRVGELGVGTNAALTLSTGDLLIDEKILGTVHIALGRAYPECGGINRSALHWDIVKDLRAGAGGSGGSIRAGDCWLIRDGVVQPVLRAASVAGDPRG